MAIIEPVVDWARNMLLIPLALLGRTYLDDSFGTGFLRYRADLGWPRGVQEDDDMHWTWTATAEPDPDEAERPELAPVIGHTGRRHWGTR